MNNLNYFCIMSNLSTFLLFLFISLLIIINISYYESYYDRRLLVNNENCENNIPKLNDNPLTTVPPTSRYIPLTNNEQLTSIYTWWNILDRTMEHNYLMTVPNSNSDKKDTLSKDIQINVSPKWIYGYVRDNQMKVYRDALNSIKNNEKKRYCEIGVNGGHGTVAMLLSDPNLDVVSFDLGAYKYSEPVYNLISMAFPNRIQFKIGSSYDLNKKNKKYIGTVPEFVKLIESGEEKSCDIILVDGDHRQHGASLDLHNMRNAASCNNILLYDDLDQASGGSFQAAENEGILEIIQTVKHTSVDDKNPCIRWVGAPECYGATDDAFIRKKCQKCIQKFGFATAKFINPPQCSKVAISGNNNHY